MTVKAANSLRESLSTSDNIMVAVVLFASTATTCVLTGMTAGFFWRLHQDGGRLSDGALGCFLAVLALGPTCVVAYRLACVAWFWTEHPSEQSIDGVAEWREAMRLPIVTASAVGITFAIVLVAGFTRSEIPRGTSLAVLGLLGLGTLSSLPASWMTARNVASDLPRNFSWKAHPWVKWFIPCFGVALALISFASTVEPPEPSMPLTPPTYCYSHRAVQGLTDSGVAQSASPLVRTGEAVPEAYCFSAPLPSGK